MAYEDKVDEIVSSDEDVQSYVKLLEERADETQPRGADRPLDLPSGDTIAAELEDFLRDREN